MLNSFARKLLLTTLLFITGTIVFAQEKVEMADGLRSSGKIYVVVAVLAIVFIGLLLYLISIDRKISRIEKKENQK